MIKDAPDGAIIAIKVIPRAGRTAIAGTRDDVLLIRLAAAPVDGSANSALVNLLAAVVGVAKRDVVIISGEKSRTKRVKIAGMTAAALRARLSFDKAE